MQVCARLIARHAFKYIPQQTVIVRSGASTWSNNCYEMISGNHKLDATLALADGSDVSPTTCKMKALTIVDRHTATISDPLILDFTGHFRREFSTCVSCAPSMSTCSGIPLLCQCMRCSGRMCRACGQRADLVVGVLLMFERHVPGLVAAFAGVLRRLCALVARQPQLCMRVFAYHSRCSAAAPSSKIHKIVVCASECVPTQ